MFRVLVAPIQNVCWIALCLSRLQHDHYYDYRIKHKHNNIFFTVYGRTERSSNREHILLYYIPATSKGFLRIVIMTRNYLSMVTNWFSMPQKKKKKKKVVHHLIEMSPWLQETGRQIESFFSLIHSVISMLFFFAVMCQFMSYALMVLHNVLCFVIFSKFSFCDLF